MVAPEPFGYLTNAVLISKPFRKKSLDKLGGAPRKFSTVMLVHMLNAASPMLVTLEGIVTAVRPVQLENAWLPMLVTLPGIVTAVRPVQLKKADWPMLVTLEGIVMAVRPVQLENAWLPMLVTLKGIVTAPVMLAGASKSVFCNLS